MKPSDITNLISMQSCSIVNIITHIMSIQYFSYLIRLCMLTAIEALEGEICQRPPYSKLNVKVQAILRP